MLFPQLNMHHLDACKERNVTTKLTSDKQGSASELTQQIELSDEIKVSMKHVVITKVLPGCCICRDLHGWLGAVINKQIPLSLWAAL